MYNSIWGDVWISSLQVWIVPSGGIKHKFLGKIKKLHHIFIIKLTFWSTEFSLFFSIFPHDRSTEFSLIFLLFLLSFGVLSHPIFCSIDTYGPQDNFSSNQITTRRSCWICCSIDTYGPRGNFPSNQITTRRCCSSRDNFSRTSRPIRSRHSYPRPIR